MSNSYNANTPEGVQDLVDAITGAIGNNLAFDFSESVGFSLTIQLTPDGSTLNVTAHSGDQGQNLRPAFSVDTSLLP